jgi:hypothetical protein
VERLAPVIQGTTVELIHQPEDGEGARIIAAVVAARLRRRDRIAMQFVAVHESNDPTRHSVEAWELAPVGLTLAS